MPKLPKDKVKFPGPGSYSPKIEMGQDEVFKKNARTIIGRSTLDILDYAHFKREKSQVPGPGSYQSFSEFNVTLN